MVVGDKRSFEENLLKIKKAKFVAAVERAAKYLKRKPPKVVFWKGRCPYDGGNEWAHIHGERRIICVSEDKLREMDYEDIEDTATHETTHLIDQTHDPGFYYKHDQVKVGSWRGQNKKIKRTREKKTLQTHKKECSYHLCDKKTNLHKCEYCGKLYCKKHLSPKPPCRPSFYSRGKHSAVLQEEWRREDAHPCVDYLEHREAERKRKDDAYKQVLERVSRIKNGEPKPIRIDSWFDEITPDYEMTEREVQMIKSYENEPAVAIQKKSLTKTVFAYALFGLAITILLIAVLFYGLPDWGSIFNKAPLNCSDGTIYNACSINTPFYCYNGSLIERADICGCQEGYKPIAETCEKIKYCADKTAYNECSLNRPLYCLNGVLINRASVCSCPDGKGRSGERCI
ncbi:MAG: hypothetical protein ABIB71_02685 [Candidatus Woesearchaeota archaeon]